jgi:hypothetical protein
MYYSGWDKATGSSIGMATSSDGKSWTKYNDPKTTDARFSDSDPVLTSADPIVRVGQPVVFQTANGFEMIHKYDIFKDQNSPPTQTLRHSTSPDGIVWTISPGDPIWLVESIPGASSFWFTSGVYHNGTYYLFVEGGIGSVTDIYVAMYKGSSLPN